MTRRRFLKLSCVAFAPRGLGIGRVQNSELAAGKAVFDRLMALAVSRGWRSRAIGPLTGEIALELLNTPYVGFTLETSDSVESCVVNLEGLDCVTLFESSLGMARAVKLGALKPADLIRQVTLTRYRGGVLNGYVSRLHYTSEWISDNAKKGVVRDLTADLPGAERFEKKIDFMSTHPESYRQLKAHPEWIPEIAEVEKRLSASILHHVPAAKVAAIEPLLHTGDVVGITTSVPGIDCSHTGLCFRSTDGRLRFLHASSRAKKVILDDSLSEYLKGSSANLGVMIARPVEP